ncbi:MAG: hypothetical protein R3D02_06025 [Hyphomicrobiales bacterium]
MLKAIFLSTMIAIVPLPALAEADGPDAYRVTGVARNDVLNIRSGPSARFDIVGTIPHDGRGLRNLAECTPKPAIDTLATMSPKALKALRQRTWCRIAYGGVTGWVAARYLAEDSGE